MRLFKTIKFRMTIWNVVVIIALLAIFAITAYAMLSHEMYRNLDKSLLSREAEVQSTLRAESTKPIGGTSSELVLFYDANNNVAQGFGTDIELVNINNLIERAFLGQSSFMNATTRDGREMRLYAAPFVDKSVIRYAVVVGRSPSEIQNVLGTLKSILGISALIMIVLVGVGGAFLADRNLRPVDRITGTARDISENDLSRRIDLKSEDELGRLASTLNKMIERLEVGFKRQRQFTADASHEMRTPLAVIQVESTLALKKERTVAEYQKTLELISQEVDYMSDVIGKLLLLAHGDAGKEHLRIEDVNLSELITQLGADMKVLAKEKGLQFDLDTIENLTVKGDKVKLRQMLLNIISNAIKFTSSGGNISTTLIKQKDKAIVTIKDTGIGIATEHLPLIFERFYRIDKSRSRSEGGSGLGLAIANQIVQVHKGKIEVESEVGKGSIFRIILPI